MVGGGSRRDEGPIGVSRSNVFAALDTLRKKKKPENSRSKGSSKPQAKEEAPVVWAPAPLTVKSWADVDDDDDYFATGPPPPLPAWGTSEPQDAMENPTPFDEETESEDDGLDDGDEDIDDEPENEPEVQVVESIVTKPSTPVVKKEAERQLSKKELKKKELEELDAVLAEFGIASNDGHVDDSQEKSQEPDLQDITTAPAESKTAKKKKKKEKASKETRDPQEQPLNVIEDNNPDDTTVAEPGEDAPAVDVKERLKKMASMKKKKSSKEMDGAAKSAAAEAAARSAKLAAAKKKEKAHYNQQPLR